MQDSVFVHIQCVPLRFSDGKKLFWECGCSFHRGQCSTIQTLRTDIYHSNVMDAVMPCKHVRAMQKLTSESSGEFRVHA